MDRRQGLTPARLATVVALCVGAWHPQLGCGGAAPRADVRVVARGSLAYAVAFCGERLVSIELVERFAVVVRDADSLREAARIDLGPPERDWPALACDARRAWVGGDAGTVAIVDLAAGAIVGTWPVGAPVTGLAVDGERIAIGDGSGVLCLRRADDGALLQCVVAQVGAVDVEGTTGGLVTRAPDGDGQVWSTPALARVGPAPTPALRVTGRSVDRRRGEAWERVVRMAGAVQGVAVSPSGAVAVAAWIGALDDASVVLVSSDTIVR